MEINPIIQNVLAPPVLFFLIGAISVIFPISFLLSAVGMSIGIGGGSIVSRALGSNDEEKAQLSFNNQISLTLFLAFLIDHFFFDPSLTMEIIKLLILVYMSFC